MQCMILFPGHDGRLPSADELRRAGLQFVLSAALGRAQAGADPGEGLARAAEDPAVYPALPGPGLSGPGLSGPEPPPGPQPESPHESGTATG